MNCETRTRGKMCGREECKPCFKRSFASCDKAKYLAEGQENPLLIANKSHKKLKFDCPKCKHVFETAVHSVNKGCFCPFCSGRTLCGSNDCGMCTEKSFAGHARAVFWDFEKNKHGPSFVSKQSNKKFCFKCGECLHNFSIQICKIFIGRWCPYCSNQKLCESSECGTCFEKSFASHEKAKYWDVQKNKKTPREVFRSATGKYWFLCDSCTHGFKSRIGDVTKKRGQWCPYCCVPRRFLCKEENCEVCFLASFASDTKAVFWSPVNSENSREVMKFSNKKYSFVCEKGHIFSSVLSSISLGTWCPKCKNKTEAKLLSFLEEHFEDPVHQFKVSWCKSPETNKFLPFDFCVSKTIIELDGPQHYKQISNWKSPEVTQKSDRYKEEQAIKNGYSVLRILQEDVWNDRIDWKNLLLGHIKDYETPVVENLWEIIEKQQE